MDDSSNITMVEPETCQDVDVGTGTSIRRMLQSGLSAITGGQHNNTTETELEDMKAAATVGESPVSILRPKTNIKSTVDNFDICREYLCDSDDELHERYFNDNEVAAKKSAPTESSVTTYVLGKKYHPVHDYNARRDDESSLFWFTYRCDFPTIEPYGITSDAGWGCMLRALQMLMGQALRLHCKSREWRPQPALSSRRQDPFLRSILTWFADFPSSKESVYSLHNMVAAGLAKYDKLPGEWYGPGTACYVLRDLVELHSKQHANLFRVHVAAGGTVYRDSIEDTMTRNTKAEREAAEQERAKNRPEPSHPLDSWEEVTSNTNIGEDIPTPWDTPLLLMIPLRLGLKTFNNDYIEGLAHVFSLPQSVGVLGGRPRGARWFYGALSDGSKTFGLDPHTVQSAPRRDPKGPIDFSDEYLRSVHTTYIEVCSMARLDPSIALGFYCRNRHDLEHVFSSLQQWSQAHPKKPELFAVADKAPDYASPSCGAGADAAMLELSDDDDGESACSNEEDEFVVL